MASSINIAPPPLSQHQNVVELTASSNSTITGVSLYSGRAEVTRLFTFTVKTGQNLVHISGLPSVLDRESLKVEGRGAATIHDVTVSTIPSPAKATSSPQLDALRLKKTQLGNALERSRKVLAALNAYIDGLNTKDLDNAQIGDALEGYESVAGKWDEKVLDLNAELKIVKAEIAVEKRNLQKPGINENLNMKVSIGVFAQVEGEVDVALVYAVSRASWSAGYDIRVDMKETKLPVSLVYKAAITQNTGEDWNHVPLTLETAMPTFGLGVPTLTTWTLSEYRPPPPIRHQMMSMPVLAAPIAPGASALGGIEREMSRKKERKYARRPSDSDEEEIKVEDMIHQQSQVSSKGGITATYRVPGNIIIPSDGIAHNVTIATLQLDATMSWVTVPKKDAKTHLKAKIRNLSEYTLLAGTASVYVDGSFISKSDVPQVSPEESFDCPLGLDPSIRVTYHPIVKKTTQSGFYTRTSNHTYVQRITLFNTKSTAISNFKIIDQAPISEDSQIVVKLVSPSLILPGDSEGSDRSPRTPVRISENVTAQWDSADEDSVDVQSLGKDGKVNWICSAQPQEKVHVLLQWEVSAPVRLPIVGL